jgi:hypothetical protein
MKEFENFRIKVNGHVQIKDSDGNVLLDKKNAIHPQNMATVIARGLSRDADGYIYKLCFGNGGTFFNSSGQIVYRPPNTIGTADLYNLTYEVNVDDQSTGTPVTNSVTSSASPSPAITSIVTITTQLNANEPAGQAVQDNVTVDPESLFTFDEIGLKSPDGLLLSHLVFNPFEKTGNRAFLITYTLTISVS